MSLVYLVRHGQASFGAESYDQLSALGYQQAQYLGQHLAALNIKTPLFISGGMQRHQQTASTALGETPWVNTNLKLDARWNEFNHQQVFERFDPRFSQPDLLKVEIAKSSSPRAYLAQIFEGAIDRWIQGQHDHEYDETWDEFRNRVNLGLETLKQELMESSHSSAVIFSSGGAISVAIGQILGLQPQQCFELNWSIANCSISCIRLKENRWQFVSFNEHQYLKLQSSQALTWI